MLKKFATLVLAILLIMAMSINVFAESVDFTKTSANVNFENKAVENYVREYLGIKTNRKLTIADCLKVKDFFIMDSNVLTTLNDIKYFPNLEYFAIVDQYRIIDISVLENCKNLIEIGLVGCGVSDVSVLGGLKNLEYVTFSDVPVEDASAVLALPNLKYFNATMTYIDDISALKGNKTLESLILDPGVKDISVLKNMKSLKYLYLTFEELNGSQLEILKTLNLTGLGLIYMDLTNDDMKYIKTQRNLEWLDLTGNYITKFTFLDSMKNLQAFYYDSYLDTYDLSIAFYIELFTYKSFDLRSFFDDYNLSMFLVLCRPFYIEYLNAYFTDIYSYVFDSMTADEINLAIAYLKFMQSLGVETLGELINFTGIDFDFDFDFFNIFA